MFERSRSQNTELFVVSILISYIIEINLKQRHFSSLLLTIIRYRHRGTLWISVTCHKFGRMASQTSDLLRRPLYLYDLPPEILDTIQLKQDGEDANHVKPSDLPDEDPASASEDSGSESSSDDDESETIKRGEVKNGPNIDDENDDSFVSRKHTRGSGGPPLMWFTTRKLPSNTSLGIYRAMYTNEEQAMDLVAVLRAKQLHPSKPVKPAADEGGVPLPQPVEVGPTMFMCMIGGGHFAAMVVSLTPKLGRKNGIEERQASVIAHKTFHRYTTRRKQGGAQSANDSAKGAAHSAGASIRRHNEEALQKEIRELLSDWKPLIEACEFAFVRASGEKSRRVIFGPYDGQVLYPNHPRTRGFPFSTHRATQKELMRCFVELTRVKVKEVDEAAEAAARQKKAADDQAKADAAAAKQKAAEKPIPKKDPEEEIALLHTSQLEAFIRRSKAPALASYITSNAISPDFRFHPPDTQQHHHTPTPLHMAASLNSPALISAVLIRCGADPCTKNGDSKTAFELAGDRATRDAFRLARTELGESKWDWATAQVPNALTKAEFDTRAASEKAEIDAAESARRAADLKQLQEEEAKRKFGREQSANERRDKKMGKGHMVGEKQTTGEERREEEARGMTPEMRMRLEREKRIRAVEERMKKMKT